MSLCVLIINYYIMNFTVREQNENWHFTELKVYVIHFNEISIKKKLTWIWFSYRIIFIYIYIFFRSSKCQFFTNDFAWTILSLNSFRYLSNSFPSESLMDSNLWRKHKMCIRLQVYGILCNYCINVYPRMKPFIDYLV